MSNPREPPDESTASTAYAPGYLHDPDDPKRGNSILLPLAFGLVVIGPVVYAAHHRTRPEFLLTWALVAVGVFAVLAAQTLIARLRKTPSESGLVAALVLAPIIGAVLYSYGVLLKDAFLFVYSKSLTGTGAVVTFTSVAMLTGVLLFYARLRIRALYGLTEAIVGLTVVATRVASTTMPLGARDPSFYLATLTAGVYLIVRGLDNLHQGLTREPKDKLVQKLFKKRGSRRVSLRSRPG